MEGDRAKFRFFRPDANEVCVVGDFNGWRVGELPMKRRNDGYWRLTARLPKGTFKFRYFADNEWFVDYAAFGVEHGAYGFDSILRVS